MSVPLDIAPLIYWAAGIVTLLNLANMVWMIMSGPAKKLGERIDGQSLRLTDHDQRITALEQSMRSLPVKDDLHGVQLALSEMRGDLREMRAIMGRMETIVTRHEDHLLDGGKR